MLQKQFTYLWNDLSTSSLRKVHFQTNESSNHISIVFDESLSDHILF